MTLTTEARRRIADDHVVWLTTVSDSGAPAPNPVWCALDGEDIVAFTTSDAVRVHNITQRPQVSLNFNSDQLGGDLVIISGRATVRPGRPSALESYRSKYEAAMRDLHQMTLEQFDAMFDREIRIRPLKVRPNG
jgi:PPOX class probable F420-dependent enzyme